MASSKLLKEAIADAKAVRETALANAKLQLEEAFTPRLKSILSQKLRAEAEDMEADDEMHEEEEEDKMEEELSSSNIGGGAQPTLDSAEAEDELGAADVTKTSGKPEDEVEDYDFAKSITEEEEEEMEMEEGEGEDEMEMEEGEEEMEAPSEDDLDLEAIIRELEDELGTDDEMEEDADDVDTYMNADDSDSSISEEDEEEENPNAEKIAELRKEIAKLEGYGEDEEASEMEEGEEEDGEEELNIESIIKELEDEEAAEEEEKAAVAEAKSLKNELRQAISVIKTLKSTINEINLLNAKLLYSNKLFRGYNLTNEQKSKVIDSFDRTGTIREVKLVYSTIAESMKMGGSVKKVESVKRITEGASKPQKSTGVKKQIISENSAYSDRFKQLAGLIK
jgi:hypothetical protein